VRLHSRSHCSSAEVLELPRHGVGKTTTTGVGTGGSPHVRSEWTIDGAVITVEYGRPYLRGRPEALMMPPGRPWRTGADAATVLRTNKRLHFGSVALAAGSYTVFSQPGDPWQLIFGSLAREGQWGSPYDPALELARVKMVAGKSDRLAEQVTISVIDTRIGATLRIAWGLTIVSAAFTIG
jgi:hypothetical protein